MAEPAQRQSLMERNARSNEGESPIRRLLSQLFSGWGTNNSAGAASSPYKDVGAGVSVANRPDAYNAAVSREVFGQQPQPDLAQQLAYQRRVDAIPTDTGPVPAAAPSAPLQRRPAPRGYDQQSMQLLVDAIDSPTTEGPNARIDDDTRARALAWALRQQNDMGV